MIYLKPRSKFWLAVIIIMFIIAIFSHPVYDGVVGPWPVNYLLTIGVGILYLVIFGIFMWDTIMNDPDDLSEVKK